MRGGLVVVGTTSDAGKSWLVAGLCRILARRGVSVAPFKAQNMALNATVTHDGGEIGHAQWVQAVAAGVPAEVAMNPVLLKPLGSATSDVIVRGRSTGVRTVADYHRQQASLASVVDESLADLRRRFDVVLCEGAGGAAEINLLHRDLANLPLAHRAGLAAVVVGDIDRGGVFAALYGTIALVPDHLRATIGGTIINRLRGDAGLLEAGMEELTARTGVPNLGVVPLVAGADLDAEDSLALPRWGTTGHHDGALDVAVIRYPHVANIGDLDPLRIEPGVAVRWVADRSSLGRPDLVVLPGSKTTTADLAWLRAQGLDAAIAASDAAVVALCAGAQMAGVRIDDPHGVEGDTASVPGLGWLPVATTFEPDKVLDRPTGTVQTGPGAGERLAGYRIHHGRVHTTAISTATSAGAGGGVWATTADGTPLGWWHGAVVGTTVHAALEDDGLRRALLTWAAHRHGRPVPPPPPIGFEAARQRRLDGIADVLEAHLDLDAVFRLIERGAP